VRGGRHRHDAHKHAGESAAHQQVRGGPTAERQHPTYGADHVTEQHRSSGPERVHQAVRDQASHCRAQSGQTSCEHDQCIPFIRKNTNKQLYDT